MASRGSQALELRAHMEAAEEMAKVVDRYMYNHGLPKTAGTPLADAVNDLTSAAQALKNAAFEQAFRELTEEVKDDQ